MFFKLVPSLTPRLLDPLPPCLHLHPLVAVSALLLRMRLHLGTGVTPLYQSPVRHLPSLTETRHSRSRCCCRPSGSMLLP